MTSRRARVTDDVMQHLAAIREGMTTAERAAYDERVLAIRTVLELVEQRRKRRLSQRTLAARMGVSQPVVARLEKPLVATYARSSSRIGVNPILAVEKSKTVLGITAPLTPQCLPLAANCP